MLGEHAWLAWVWMVICIILVIGLAYWATRFLGRQPMLSRFRAGQGERQLEILDQLALGKSQRLVVVKIAGRFYVLGVTETGISMLAELTAEEAAAWTSRPDASEEKQYYKFREVFKTVLKQKDGGESDDDGRLD